MNVIRAYDNGGKTADRYTVVFMAEPESQPGTFAALGMNSQPFHGIGMHCAAMPGKHLGKRIEFDTLPHDCQRAVLQDLGGAWPHEVETMARHYIIAALWADCPEGTHPRATKRSHMLAIEQCAAFLQHIGASRVREIRDLPDYGAHPDCGSVAPNFAALGHDFYLTRAGHGAGFFDRDTLPEDLRDYLENQCGWRKPFGETETDFYRGWLHLMR